MSGDSTPSRIVGRDEELGRVSAALAAVDTGGQAFGILGDPGVGKSALLASATVDAQRRVSTFRIAS